MPPMNRPHLRRGLAVGLSLVIALVPLGAAGCRNARGPEPRPETWAVAIERDDLPNFHRLSDGLYRSAQPTPEGLAAFEAMGGRTVINLRTDDTDQPAIGELDLDYVRIPMSAWTADLEDVQRFLAIAIDPARQPVLVHCQHGADRTGLMCAAYRVVVEGWDKDQAIAEMTTGGYHFSPFWGRLPGLIQRMDEASMRQAIAREP